VDDAGGAGSVGHVSDVDGKGEKNFRFQRMPCNTIFRVNPSRNYMAMNACPSCSPTS